MERVAPPSLLRPMRRFAALFVIAVMGLFLSAPAQAGRIEAGTFTAHDTFQNKTTVRVSFQEPFDTPPIVIVLPSQAGNNSASIQITNIGTDGFDEVILEPDNWDGEHVAMVVPYIAVEPGRHVLPGGTVIEAGFEDLSNVQFGTGFSGGVASWRSVSFSAPLAGTPLVLHQLQSANSETRNVPDQSSRPHITSIAQSLSPSGFQLALDRSQANSGPFPSTETVGWVAIESGLNGSFRDIAGNSVNWSSRTTTANIRGWDNGCFGQAHGVAGATNPIVVAKKITRNNNDGGWLRYCSINGSTITLRVDEDRDQDNERSIATADAEAAAIMAFSRAFHANLRAQLNVTKVRTSISNANGSDFGLPGGVVTYLITVNNSGNAPPNEDSVIVTERIPAELDLLLADFGGAGNGPVDFDEGTPAPNITCSFGGFADTSDCFSFSTDGVDYSYVPSDSGDGTDPNLRFVRIQPSGFMNGDDGAGAGAPNFRLRLRARIR